MGIYANFNSDNEADINRVFENKDAAFQAKGSFIDDPSFKNWNFLQNPAYSLAFSDKYRAVNGAMEKEFNDYDGNIINGVYQNQGPYFGNKSRGFAKGVNVAANNRILGKDTLGISFTGWAATKFGSGLRPSFLDSSPEATHVWLDTVFTGDYIAKKGLYTWQMIDEFRRDTKGVKTSFWDLVSTPVDLFTGGLEYLTGADLVDNPAYDNYKKAYRAYKEHVEGDYREQALGWAWCTATNCNPKTMEEYVKAGEDAHKWAAEKLGPDYISPYEGYRADLEKEIDIPDDKYVPSKTHAEASLWTIEDENAGAEVKKLQLIRCCDVRDNNGRYNWGYLQVRAQVQFPSGQIETKIVSDGTKASGGPRVGPYLDSEGIANPTINVTDNLTKSETMYEGTAGWPAQTLTHSISGEPVALTAGAYNFEKGWTGPRTDPSSEYIEYEYAYNVRDSTGKRRTSCEIQTLYTAGG